MRFSAHERLDTTERPATATSRALVCCVKGINYEIYTLLILLVSAKENVLVQSGRVLEAAVHVFFITSHLDFLFTWTSPRFSESVGCKLKEKPE